MRNAILLTAAMVLAACAGSPDTTYDPYESFNRQTFAMNRRMDRTILRPAAEFYVDAVPAGARRAMHNLLTTANMPVVFANDILQGDPREAGRTLARLTANIVFGPAGLRNAAGEVGLPDHSTDFGTTLAVWGWGDTPYLMVPLVGPCNPRDVLGYAGDIALDPGFSIQYKQYVWWITARKTLTIVDARSRNLEALDDIERASLDYYSTVRSLYRQHRAGQTGDGEP
jgi:phospholipid-binding lipoprotein MlaA